MTGTSSLLAAQDSDFPRDTSYTIRSAYQKYVKDYPDIDTVWFEYPENVHEQKNRVYKTIGNRKLHLDLYTDGHAGFGPVPLVILIHGGGWISGDRTMLRPIAIELANNGYAAMTVEYRLSPEAQYPAAVEDIQDAINWVYPRAGAYNIDKNKIAIMGTSAGGQLAALVGTLDRSEKIKAIIDVDGVLAFIHPVSEEGRVAGLWLGGSAEEKKKTWMEASALTHADSTSPPTLFIGSKYPRFLAGHEEMMQILSDNGIHSEIHRFEDAPHSFWLFHPWFNPTVDHVMQFLNEVFRD